jgi:hypothetical protein
MAPGRAGEPLVDVFERISPVNFGFTGAEEIQVGPVKEEDVPDPSRERAGSALRL